MLGWDRARGGGSDQHPQMAPLGMLLPQAPSAPLASPAIGASRARAAASARPVVSAVARTALTVLVGLFVGAITAAASEAPRPAAAPQDATGFAALRAGQYDEAARTLRAEALDGNAAALSGWVTALRETGDYEGAVDAAERGWSGGWGAHMGSSGPR